MTPELVNAVIGAAADPEPIVRASAVRTLAVFGREDRIVAAVLARLVDSARVVRRNAAETLLAFGIADLPGRAGEALARAQDEFVLGMNMFPDAAGNHAEVGWMQSERGRLEEAHRALDRATALDARFARPLVIKGVLAARAERFGEAVDLWKKAREIDPAYPNIDRLIAEASSRR
jgi:tetratricopeptide (TPR) repeat protein